MSPDAIVVQRFETPDEVRRFEKGTLEIVRIGGMTLGRATYEPGWRWSEHVRPLSGTASCAVEHVGVVLAGTCVVAMDGGERRTLRAGDVFHVAPGHDSWVEGDERYVSLHLLGAGPYASR